MAALHIDPVPVKETKRRFTLNLCPKTTRDAGELTIRKKHRRCLIIVEKVIPIKFILVEDT